MDEKIREIVDKYSFHVDSVSRGRGAFICSTDEGPRIVRSTFWRRPALSLNPL